MYTMKKILITIALLCAGIANAAPMTSTIPVPVPGNGVVAPKSTLSVPLDALLVNAQYKVECNVTNSSNTNVGMAFGVATGGGVATSGQFIFNGKFLSSNQAMLLPTTNIVISPGVICTSNSPQNALTFQNVDDTNSVVVSDCVAHFVVGK